MHVVDDALRVAPDQAVGEEEALYHLRCDQLLD